MLGHQDLEELDESTCWELMTRAEVARVGIHVDGVIAVFPVNHLVDRGRIAWRSAAGAKLGVAAAEEEVAVEFDEINAHERWGWSVMARGVIRIVTDPERLSELLARDFTPWSAPDERELWLELEPHTVVGHRLG